MNVSVIPYQIQGSKTISSRRKSNWFPSRFPLIQYLIILNFKNWSFFLDLYFLVWVTGSARQ